MLGDQQQRLHRGLPFGGVVFGLGQFGDVLRGVAKCDELLALGQFDWVVNWLVPGHYYNPTPITCRLVWIEVTTPLFKVQVDDVQLQLFPKSVASVRDLAHENITRTMLDLSNQH
jgi:hypothetical protein